MEGSDVHQNKTLHICLPKIKAKVFTKSCNLAYIFTKKTKVAYTKAKKQ